MSKAVILNKTIEQLTQLHKLLIEQVKITAEAPAANIQTLTNLQSSFNNLTTEITNLAETIRFCGPNFCTKIYQDSNGVHQPNLNILTSDSCNIADKVLTKSLVEIQFLSIQLSALENVFDQSVLLLAHHNSLMTDLI